MEGTNSEVTANVSSTPESDEIQNTISEIQNTVGEAAEHQNAVSDNIATIAAAGSIYI